ncbi:MAG: replication-associated recombination protein A [Bacteroidales bacterium]|nr:replication-associated recombination protein A [Candidatus Cacconaster equifaecalis]
MERPNIPLPERLRPHTLDEYVGQEHLVGKGAVLRKMIESGKISSFILWGPPGVGKTTLARIVANQLNREFFTLSAISSGVKDVRDVIEKARSNRMFQTEGSPILFIDEIHRFNKAQQDALLGAVESGVITLIGATTENPSFEVISPLLSRCQVYVLKSLEVKDLDILLTNALKKDTYLKNREIRILEKEALFRFSGGDARKLLNVLEIVIQSFGEDDKIEITNKVVTDCLQENIALYDKNGEMHYDIISAFIKSIRGSDPNGAIYYMARMLAGGEDPLFIARRMLILASEDVGLANPNAALLAESCYNAVHQIGMPEARIILAETCIYLASSPKSNSAIMAIDGALAMVNSTNEAPPVPLHLRNAPTKLMQELGYAKDYKYAHSFEGNFVDQEFLPDELKGHKFYDPGNNARENEIRVRLGKLWKKYDY